MKIAVVADLQNYRDSLRGLLSLYLEQTRIHADVTLFESEDAFLQSADLPHMDLVFLDVSAGELSLITSTKEIRRRSGNCPIVLNGVPAGFAQESGDIGALYTLTRPCSYELFAALMRRVSRPSDSSDRFIEVIADRKKTRVDIGDILYVDKLRNSIQLHMADRVLKVYTMTFQEVQKALLVYPGFIQCYQCILVNMRHVHKISGRDFLLTNGEFVPINRDRFADIRESYTKHLSDSASC